MNKYLKISLKVIGGIVGTYALICVLAGAAGLVNYYFISGQHQAVEAYVKAHQKIAGVNQ